MTTINATASHHARPDMTRRRRRVGGAGFLGDPAREFRQRGIAFDGSDRAGVAFAVEGPLLIAKDGDRCTIRIGRLRALPGAQQRPGQRAERRNNQQHGKEPEE